MPRLSFKDGPCATKMDHDWEMEIPPVKKKTYTPVLKFNMVHLKISPPEEEIPFGNRHSQVPC